MTKERVTMSTQNLLQRCHDLLDDANADGGGPKPLCKYCTAIGYGGDGIEHRVDCIILALRQALEPRKGVRVDPPFDDSEPCIACPVEVRNLQACATNLLLRLDDYGRPLPGENAGEKVASLRAAVATMRAISDAHFADPMHAHGHVAQRTT